MTEDLFDLSGKVALVTGGGTGLGRAIALGLADAGAAIMVVSRNLGACEETAKAAREKGRRALAAKCHLGFRDEIKAVVDLAYLTFGRIDVLVNNSAIAPMVSGGVATSEELFDKIVSVNLRGPFHLMALVGPRMVEAGSGAIINISSIAASNPLPSIGVYAATKAGLNAMSVAFAHEFAPLVRVNVISPGDFDTRRPGLTADRGSAAPVCAMRRKGRVEEIVTTALYLASSRSSFTTGANVVVDGLISMGLENAE